MIDKDEAIKILCDGCTADCDVSYTACITVQKIIDMPTIKTEVRHGRWIQRKNGQYYCTNCGREERFIFQKNYCPKCGVKMDVRTLAEVDLDIVDSVMMGDIKHGD